MVSTATPLSVVIPDGKSARIQRSKPELPRTRYRVGEVASMNGVSETFVRESIYAGRLHATKTGRIWLISEDAIREWIDGPSAE